MQLDFAADGAAYGGYVRRSGSSFWAGAVGVGRHPLVALRDDALPPGRGGDVRTDGLWASVTCETPGEHWSVGMEAFAVGYDDPVDAVGDERGDRVALGLDLEWEREGDLWRVHGDLLVDDARIAVDGFGTVADGPYPLVTGRLGDAAFVTSDVIPVVTPDGLFRGGVALAGDVRAQLEPRYQAPVKRDAGPNVARALCTLAGPDGLVGVAWAATH